MIVKFKSFCNAFCANFKKIRPKRSFRFSFPYLNGNIKKIQYEDFVIAGETYASGEAKMKTLKRTLSGYPFATAIVGASPTEHLAQYTVSSPSVLNAIASEAYVSVRNGYAGSLTTALQIRLFSYTN